MNRALPSPSNVLFRHLRHGALALCLPLALSAPGLALAQTDVKSTPDANESETAKAPVTEQAFPQRGNVTVAGKRIDYTVTPGTLTIRNDEGEPIASMFYVGYVADNPGNRERPVTFVFNGGPGSSTMWLHIGSFGPVRVDTPTDKISPPAPFNIGKNPDSLIDKTDFVFIDMMGAGLSRPLGKLPTPSSVISPSITAGTHPNSSSAKAMAPCAARALCIPCKIAACR